MKLIVVWRRRRLTEPLELESVRFRQTLRDACNSTRYYKSFARVARLAGDLSPRECLPYLPRVDLREYLCHKQRFEIAGDKTATARKLHYPLPTNPRLAILCRGFRQSWRVRIFPEHQAPELARFHPEALAGPVDTLRALARSVEAGYLWLPPLREAIVAFTGILEGPLTEEDRDLLWRVFEVPVFEQFRGFDQELLAAECEVHQGLHIRNASAIFETDARRDLLVSFLSNRRHPALRLDTGFTGEIDDAVCCCGDASPRLLRMARREIAVEQPRMAVAVAAGR